MIASKGCIHYLQSLMKLFSVKDPLLAALQIFQVPFLGQELVCSVSVYRFSPVRTKIMRVVWCCYCRTHFQLLLVTDSIPAEFALPTQNCHFNTVVIMLTFQTENSFPCLKRNRPHFFKSDCRNKFMRQAKQNHSQIR